MQQDRIIDGIEQGLGTCKAFAGNVDALLFPILISAVGIPVSLLTKLLVTVRKEEDVAPLAEAS